MYDVPGPVHTELWSDHCFACVYLLGPHSSEKQGRCQKQGDWDLSLKSVGVQSSCPLGLESHGA